jgi:serine/threonine protein kinase
MTQEKVHAAALKEVQMIKAAESQMLYKDGIVKVHGVCFGKLPKYVSTAMNLSVDIEAVGIVMRLHCFTIFKLFSPCFRYEGGGSLFTFIHGVDKTKKKTGHVIPMEEKLRLLSCLARGLAELHCVGIIHADIKPDNILLNTQDVNPIPRLADFGLSVMKTEVSIGLSTLAETSHVKGTPIYCAPEQLHNPYLVVDEDAEVAPVRVAKPSRKTDIYSFAILMWEVLAEQKPYANIDNEVVLSVRVIP